MAGIHGPGGVFQPYGSCFSALGKRGPGVRQSASRARRALHWPPSLPLLLLLPSPSPHPIGLSQALFPEALARCLCASVADPFDHLVLFCVFALRFITGTIMIRPCKASDIYRSTYRNCPYSPSRSPHTPGGGAWSESPATGCPRCLQAVQCSVNASCFCVFNIFT